DPMWSDDDYAAKLDLVRGLAWVSFTFGCPTAQEVKSLHEAGTRVVVTVTHAREAECALAAGAAAICAQGREAGGHQGGFLPDLPRQPLLELLQSVRGGLPVIAAGGLMTADDCHRAIQAGAAAAQLGTAFLRCPEAGTHETHRRALVDPQFTQTRLTSAFTGR